MKVCLFHLDNRRFVMNVEIINDKLNIVIDTMNQKFEKIDERFEKIDEQLSDLKDGQEKLCTRVTNLELLYENEIKRDIQLIAEGHSIIIRKLDELLKVKDDHEYTKIRLDILESRVNRLEKERIS